MSFTREIKRDLLKTVPKEREEGFALLGAMLTAGGDLRADGFTFTSEDEDVSAYFMTLTEQLFRAPAEVVGAERDPKRGRDKLTFSHAGSTAELFEPPETEEAARAFLKGAFLGGGSCTLPHAGAKTGYHLEVVFPAREDAETFSDLLDGMQLIGNIVVRGEKYVVYLKSREAISDFLAVLGAYGALSTLETVTAAREESNNENRVSNCYQGNADKAAIASAGQVVAIGKLASEGRLAALAEPLRTAAQARLENPELSLAELADLIGVTKSCLNHRMRKLLELSRRS